jgi:hypothetical protein
MSETQQAGHSAVAGQVDRPVLVWAHDNHPHEMAAFIGPPEAVINV